MQINQYLTAYNYTPSTISRIKYIVIHFVGALGGAKDNCIYFAGGNRGASAHYFVGFDGEIWQSVRDQDAAWAVGGMPYVHPECRNANSLSIEMCVRKKNTKSESSSDKDWYYEDATVKSTIELTKYLMKKYNVPVDHVIRHYDVNHKMCPTPYVMNNTKHTWTNFKKAIASGGDVVLETPEVKFDKTGDATCSGQDVRVREVANGPIMEYLDKGQALEIDGKTDATWTHVKVSKTGTVGWVSTQYVSVKVVEAPKQDTTTTSKDTANNKTTTNTTGLYRVGTAWKNNKCENQHGAFSILDNAKEDCDIAMKENKKTYHVYDSKGTAVYEAAYKESASSNKATVVEDDAASIVKDAQIHINNFSGSKLTIDGICGPATKEGLVRCLQIALNKDFHTTLDINGKVGDRLKKAIGNHTVSANGQITYTATVVQIALMAKGYIHDGVVCPGSITTTQSTVIKRYQNDHSLMIDGIVGKDTLLSLIS